MTVRGEVVLQAVRELWPKRFAVERDVTGLQVGREDREVGCVLCTLDLTLEVAQEAVTRGAGLIISHHAVIFRPLKNLRTDTFKGKILELLIKNDITVYVPHTALDVAAGGMNDHLAESVGLTKTRTLEQTGRDDCQLLVGAGSDDPVTLTAALLAKGALAVDPRGDRLEVLVTERKAGAVSRALEKATGEAPRAFPLRSDSIPRGIGRVGRLPQSESLLDLARRLKAALGLSGVRVVAASDDVMVKTVAVLGGDGRSYVDKAIFAGADVLITGDLDHHTALMARARGLSLIDVGHWGSEKQVAELFVTGLREKLTDEDVEIVASEVNTNPFWFV